ncbi:hypothetical protein MHLP_01980 [Candidatus Mycoplasma haematolamae str. Purdue]|uniref:Uncharacterized protein n=1 Tax=Mycoplasma haematolamae (strain Purdue) TaxID=1212765 RepID=I7CFJ4_MYCHA|nr:hypothetical protein [Candidatus Mycoplasma haematolamae]AFO51976.1 hypothetical protein MHLP_01980 [Candidatus Mycoplasma haematolamae str. Purdue]
MLSSKLIAMMIAGSGGIAGSGFGINYYVSGWGSNKDSKVQEKSIAVSPAVISDQQELKETEKVTPLEQKPNTELKVESLSSASSENSCAWYDWSCYSDDEEDDEAVVPEESEQFKGNLYLVKAKDDGFFGSYVYKLTLDKGESLDGTSLFSWEFTSTKSQNKVNSILSSFNDWTTIGSEDLNSVASALKSEQAKLTDCFGEELFSKLQDAVNSLISKSS